MFRPAFIYTERQSWKHQDIFLDADMEWNTGTRSYFSVLVNSYHSFKLPTISVYNSFYAVEKKKSENGIFAESHICIILCQWSSQAGDKNQIVI